MAIVNARTGDMVVGAYQRVGLERLADVIAVLRGL